MIIKRGNVMTYDNRHLHLTVVAAILCTICNKYPPFTVATFQTCFKQYKPIFHHTEKWWVFSYIYLHYFSSLTYLIHII